MRPLELVSIELPAFVEIVDLEKDRSPLGFECAKVVFFVRIVGVTEVIKDERQDDSGDPLMSYFRL